MSLLIKSIQNLYYQFKYFKSAIWLPPLLHPTLGYLCGNITNLIIITVFLVLRTEGHQFTRGPISAKMNDPPQKFKISYLNSVWNFFIISNFKSSERNSKSFMGRKIFSLTNIRVDLLSNWFKSIYRRHFL